MPYRYVFALVFVVLISISCLKQQDRISINIPTVEQETQSVWNTIRDITFFEKNNYQVNLPKGKLVASLIKKSKVNQLSDQDYKVLKAYMSSTVFNSVDYQKGYRNIADQKALINQLINKLSKLKRNWKFKEFHRYQVNLTLYGSGGSFNPDNGSILIFTTVDGKFKQYDNPANTIIHETVHIGIQESIINKYKIPHALKERIVDRYVYTHFNKFLPEYRIQNMGDVHIDQYLTKKKDFSSLAQIVEEFVSK